MTVPGAPTSIAVTAAADSLTVSWAAPDDDGGAAVSAYDLRYIETDDDETADANWTLVEDAWTSGALSYSIAGLRDSTSYDVQLRAVNSEGDGAWSASTTQATDDYGSTRSSAASFALSDSTASLAGRIDSDTDADFFSFVLTETRELVLYTSGLLDTHGELQESDGTAVVSNDDGRFPESPWNFLVRARLDAGTYYIEVTGNEGATGAYELHGMLAPDDVGNSRPSAAAAHLGMVTAGRIGRPGDTSSHDADYYRLDFDTATDFYVVAFSDTVVTGQLLDSNGNDLLTSYRFFLAGELFQHYPFGSFDNALGFMLRSTVAAGTYYIKIVGNRSFFTGPYWMKVGEAPNPGTSLSTATPIRLGGGAPGRITSLSDADYFSVTAEEDGYVSLAAATLIDDPMAARITVYDEGGSTLDTSRIPHTDWYSFGRDHMADYALVPVEAGKTYGIRVQADGREIGAYFLFALREERYTAFTQECMDLTTDDTVDAFYGCQWHLDNTGQSGGATGEDINVVEVWEGGNTGAGVNIAIVDDGLYLDHEDLKDRVNTSRNYDYWTGTPGGVSNLFWVNHGTSVAGLIAAEHNAVGVRGVAPGATIYSYNFVDWLDAGEAEIRDLVDAMTRHRVGTQVSSNSWGFPDDGAPHPAEAAWIAAIETGLREGDGGRGISYVWAAGNGGDPDDYSLDNSNLDGYANFYGVTAVCAVDHSGEKSRYSEPGANLWVCAPSHGDGAFITTTKSAALLYPFGDGSDFTPGLYWGDFGGTSAAAPIVSGVVALIKSANPLLTWRDVKLILAASARKNDASDGDWEDGALQYGSDTDVYSFNHKYGFGVVDAGAAVDLAADWTNVQDQRTHEVRWTGPTRFSTVINTPYTRTVTISQSSIDFIEFVEVTAEIDHDSIRDLKIELESPTGATSLLTHSGEVRDYLGRPYSFDGALRLGSAKHLGESPVGAWKLHITDEFAGNGGTFREFRIKFYGLSLRPGAPAAPSGTSDADSLLVTWSAPSEIGGSAITSYDLRHIRSDAADKAAEHWTEVTDAQTSGALSHDLTGLTSGVRYDIQVRANNDAGAGPWSPTYVGSVAVAPGTPTNMAATARTSGLVITWDPPASDGGADIVRYEIRSSVADADSWTGWQTAWSSGDGDLRASVTGLANHTRYDVQVRAANRAGAGDPAVITAEPEPANLGPAFPASETGVREIGEHAVSPAAVGAPVLAIDPDNDQLYYSVPPIAPFVIDELTGQLRVRASLDLDYETQDTYTVQVSVSDRKDVDGNSNDLIDDRITVTVNVKNENDAPTISGPREVSVLENSEGIVAEYVGMDIEDDPLTYTLLGPDKDAFTLGGPEDETMDDGQDA